MSRRAEEQLDEFPSLTLRAKEIVPLADASGHRDLGDPDIGTMSGWQSHKIHLLDERGITQINPVLRTQTYRDVCATY